MPQFYITSEITEDRFDSTDNLEDARRIAREAAQLAPAGEIICIELDGKNIRQFVLAANGDIAEKCLIETNHNPGEGGDLPANGTTWRSPVAH